MGKISPAFLTFIMFLVAELLFRCSGKDAGATSGCILSERNALLRFKASLSDPADRLSSWNTSTDCCEWQGVECDHTSGHVTALDLQNKRYGDIYSPSSTYMLRSEALNSSILELKHLRFLDLSGNDFHLSSIPSFLGSMSQMQHLNLSCANFSDVVPHHIGSLSLLNVLDFSYNGFDGQLIVADFTWVSHLSMIRHINMSWVDLSRTNGLLKVLNMLPFVIDLRFQSSRLENKNLEHACVDSTLGHIEYLDLSDNSFRGELPCFLENMTSLRYLSLSDNKYNSCNQLHLTKLTNLVHLYLGNNSFQCSVDSISESIRDKPQLESLSIYNNSCHGDISKILINLSQHDGSRELKYLDLGKNNFSGQLPEDIGVLRKLESLWLNFNSISGPIPTSIGNLSALKYLILGHNYLSAKIPSSLGQLSNLEYLYLSSNNLDGPIPTSLGQLSNLESLDLRNNEWNGTISESHFSRLSELQYLAISNNSLKVGVRSNWVPPFQLEIIDMRSCEIVGGEFPEWLQTQKKLQRLFMSNCSISKPLPNWFWFMNLTSLELSGNSIHGEIPDSLCQMESLFLLDLSRNRFSGKLPDCWANLTRLEALSLSSNRLSGVIPDSIGGAYSLKWLKLSGNKFTGELPPALKNCAQLKVLDIGENSISGEVLEWIGDYLLNLQVLRLSSNQFYGTISSRLCQLSELHILDLANNELNGNIPHCLDNITSLVTNNITVIMNFVWVLEFYHMQLMTKGVMQEYITTLRYVVYMDLSNNSLVGEIPVEITRLVTLRFLNLSHNHLQGDIPQQIGDMNLLESLDLSSNNLSGNIPRSLSNLNFLSHLNLSHNKLTGEIPPGNQLQALEGNPYEDNPGLCGAPLPKCHEDGASNAPNAENHEVEDEDDEVERIWFYGVVTTGFATGFWGAIGVLVVKRGWRYVFFKITDGIIARMIRV